MVDIAVLAFWAAITGGTPLVLAAVPVLRSHVSERTIHLMLGLSAGILGGLALLNILPGSLSAAQDAGLPAQAVPLGLAGGFFSLLLVERHLIGAGGHDPAHGARGAPVSSEPESGHRLRPFGTLAVSALAIHGTIDGFVIPLGFELGTAVGTVIVLAVALHQIPDGFAALAVGLAASRERRVALSYILVTAVDTPLGILLGVLFIGIGAEWIAVGLAFSAGTFLFVSAADLIPELHHRARSLLVTLSILLGFFLVFALSFLPG